MGSVSTFEITLFNSYNLESLPDRQIFDEVYNLGQEIGVGSFASVNKCFRRSDSEAFAVKIINKQYLTHKEFIGLRNELIILKRVSHKNIIKLIDVFDDGKKLFMVLELCDDKDLYDQIIAAKQKSFTEEKAAEIIYTLSNALQYLHESFIVHRDLKPENILIATDGTLKITDFGLAHYQRISSDQQSNASSLSTLSTLSTSSTSSTFDEIYMNTCCGTPYYVAPEIITKNEYNYKCDIWSLGVILYVMLVGYQPFNADSLNEIYKVIAKGKYNFNSKRWHNISKEAKDLIQCLLQIDPKKRYSTKDIKQHPWIIRNIKK